MLAIICNNCEAENALEFLLLCLLIKQALFCYIRKYSTHTDNNEGA